MANTRSLVEKLYGGNLKGVNRKEEKQMKSVVNNVIGLIQCLCDCMSMHTSVRRFSRSKY